MMLILSALICKISERQKLNLIILPMSNRDSWADR